MAQNAVTEAKEARPNDDASHPSMWPVASPDQLTEEHVSRKVRDAIERHLRRSSKLLGQALLEVIESRNDLLNQLTMMQRQADKESRRLNMITGHPDIQALLVDLGLTHPQPPAQLPARRQG